MINLFKPHWPLSGLRLLHKPPTLPSFVPDRSALRQGKASASGQDALEPLHAGTDSRIASDSATSAAQETLFELTASADVQESLPRGKDSSLAESDDLCAQINTPSLTLSDTGAALLAQNAMGLTTASVNAEPVARESAVQPPQELVIVLTAALMASPLRTVGVAAGDKTAPVFADGASKSVTIAENSTGTVHTANASDNTAVTAYVLAGGADDALFNLNTSTGALSFKVAPNYEAPGSAANTNVYTVKVRASDAAGNSSVQTVTITVGDVDEVAPVFANGASKSVTIAENSTGTVHTASASDNTAVTAYVLAGGADDALFNLDASTGALSFKVAPNYEAPGSAANTNVYTVKIEARDAAGNSSVQTVTINVLDVDDVAPVFANGPSKSVNIAENSTGTVYAASASDNTAVTAYALAGGADDALFNLNTSTGALSFKVAPNYEAPGSAANTNVYTVKVRASDAAGNSSVQTVTITVGDVDEVAPVFADGASKSVAIAENSAGTVYAPSVSDNWAVMAYSLAGGVDDGLFDLDTMTGILSFKVAPNYEDPVSHSGDNTYQVGITASDAAGNSTTLALTVNVTDVNEVPINLMPSSLNAYQDTDFYIADLSVSDVDPGNEITVTLSVLHGSIYVAPSSGITQSSSGSDNITLTGSLEDVNTALMTYEAVVYRGDFGYVGNDTLQMMTSDAGDPIQSATNTVQIMIDSLVL